MYLIFDTETTGIPRNKTAPLSDLENWPRLVQIAWQLHDANGKLLSQHNYIIKPEGFDIPYKAEQIHGVSTKRALAEGHDIGKVFESAPGNVVVPNTNLKPEYAWNYEAGVQYNQAGKGNFYLSVFTTSLRNALTNRPFKFNGQDSIVYDGVKSRVNAIQNVAVAKVWGVQLGWELFLSTQLKWQSKLNWIKGKETDDVKNEQVPLRHAPPFFGSTAIQWQKNKFLLEVNTQFNGSISNADLAPSEQAKTTIYAIDANGKPYSPEWYTLNAKASYSLGKAILHIGWENITNQRYRPYSSGIVAGGSNIITSLRYSF